MHCQAAPTEVAAPGCCRCCGTHRPYRPSTIKPHLYGETRSPLHLAEDNVTRPVARTQHTRAVGCSNLEKLAYSSVG